jgi:hypothetical protein
LTPEAKAAPVIQLAPRGKSAPARGVRRSIGLASAAIVISTLAHAQAPQFAGGEEDDLPLAMRHRDEKRMLFLGAINERRLHLGLRRFPSTAWT